MPAIRVTVVDTAQTLTEASLLLILHPTAMATHPATVVDTALTHTEALLHLILSPTVMATHPATVVLPMVVVTVLTTAVLDMEGTAHQAMETATALTMVRPAMAVTALLTEQVATEEATTESRFIK